MANSWLRLYHDMPNDPKWRTIAKASKQTIPVVLAVYVHLLTIASGAVDRGTVVNVNSEDLASALDVDSAAVDAVLDAMQGRVLEGEKLSGWDKRQVNREDSSTERMRRHREKKVTQSDAPKLIVTADKKREEEIKKVQKPSLAKKRREVQAKPPCKTDMAKVRHKEFKAAVGMYWKSKNPSVEMPWGAPEGQALEIWLRESPTTTIEQFTGYLRNRFKSDANHTDRPSHWIRNVTSYAIEPLNKFHQPQSLTGAANGNGKTSQPANRALERQQISHDAIRAAVERRLGTQAGGADGPDAGLLPEPDLAPGHAGRVVEGVGGDGFRDGDRSV